MPLCNPFLLKSLFAIISLSIIIITTLAAPTYNDNYCPNNVTYDSNNIFQTNLKFLLYSLTTNATAGADGYQTFMGLGTVNVASGLFLCRADVSSATCRDCVAAAAAEITRRCPNKTESIIWYDECLLRYTNTYFKTVSVSPGASLPGEKNISASDLDSFNRTLFGLLGGLAEETANSQSAKKFAAGEAGFGRSSSSRVYAMTQCVADMTTAQCGLCLQGAIGTIPACCGGKQGARALLSSCTVRYELYRFYNISGTSPSSGKNKSGSRIALIVVLVAASIILFCFVCYFRLRRSKKNRHSTLLRENFGVDSATLESLQFSLATVEAATKKFSSGNLIGKGGFEEVYKGILVDGREIAVKKFSQSSGQGVSEFKNEILLIAKLQHRNLVTLLGFCLEAQEKMLIYEFVPNKSLDYFLFDPYKRSSLNWSKRYKIIEGIARGILYLHEHSRLKVIHRDLKPSNVLLDDNMNPKISDFGMAKMVAIDQDRGNTNRIVGTFGYMSPEYAMHGQFSEKSDIFSFGIIVLEIISAKNNARSYLSDNDEDLLTYAWRQWRDETPIKILDEDIKESCEHIEVIRCIQIGLLCIQEKPEHRPTMAKVVSYLSGPLAELPFPGEPTNSTHSGIVQKLVAGESSSGSVFSVNEMSMSKFIPR